MKFMTLHPHLITSAKLDGSWLTDISFSQIRHLNKKNVGFYWILVVTLKDFSIPYSFFSDNNFDIASNIIRPPILHKPQQLQEIPQKSF